MAEASLISTVIAVGMIPAAFLFVYSFLSGLKKWRFHNIAGTAAVMWDLGLSMGYFINRALGPATASTFPSGVRACLAVHGIISAPSLPSSFASWPPGSTTGRAGGGRPGTGGCRRPFSSSGGSRSCPGRYSTWSSILSSSVPRPGTGFRPHPPLAPRVSWRSRRGISPAAGRNRLWA